MHQVTSKDNIYNPYDKKIVDFFQVKQNSMSCNGIFYEMRIEFTGDKVIHERSIYSILDLISDIGGVFDGLRYIGQFILGVAGLLWNRSMYDFLISIVFSV